jgi:hypothetical protein
MNLDHFNIVVPFKEEDVHLKLNKILQKRGIHVPAIKLSPKFLWSENSYGLNQTSIYQSLVEEKKQALLLALSNSRLDEAMNIECLGMSYCAKMVTKADNLNERMMFSQIGIDEVKHFSFFCEYKELNLNAIVTNPFLALLAEVVSEGTRNGCLFILQILLEGWGLSYYHALAEETIDDRLRMQIRSILSDEASHHGSGLVLFDQRNLSTLDLEYIEEVLGKFLYMVQVGELGLLQSVEAINSGMSREQKLIFLNEVKSQDKAGQKLNILKALIKKANTFQILEKFEKMDMFSPLNYEQVC